MISQNIEQIFAELRVILTKRQYQIMVLNVIYNLNVTQIAQELGIAKSGVSRSILTSKEKIEKKIREEMGEIHANCECWKQSFNPWI